MRGTESRYLVLIERYRNVIETRRERGNWTRDGQDRAVASPRWFSNELSFGGFHVIPPEWAFRGCTIL
jgi:hypothetical protein